MNITYHEDGRDGILSELGAGTARTSPGPTRNKLYGQSRPQSIGRL